MHFEILLEDVKDKFELILEGHTGLRHEIKDMRQEMNEKFELVDFKIEALSTKIDGVEKRLDAKIDSVHKKLDAKIDVVASNLAAHRADTESHPKGYKVSDMGSEA